MSHPTSRCSGPPQHQSNSRRQPTSPDVLATEGRPNREEPATHPKHVLTTQGQQTTGAQHKKNSKTGTNTTNFDPSQATQERYTRGPHQPLPRPLKGDTSHIQQDPHRLNTMSFRCHSKVCGGGGGGGGGGGSAKMMLFTGKSCRGESSDLCSLEG